MTRVTFKGGKLDISLLQVKLSTERQVALTLPLGKGGEPIVAKLTRAELDRLTAPLFRRLQLPVDACCWQVKHYSHHFRDSQRLLYRV